MPNFTLKLQAGGFSSVFPDSTKKSLHDIKTVLHLFTHIPQHNQQHVFDTEIAAETRSIKSTMSAHNLIVINEICRENR